MHGTKDITRRDTPDNPKVPLKHAGSAALGEPR